MCVVKHLMCSLECDFEHADNCTRVMGDIDDITQKIRKRNVEKTGHEKGKL